MKKILEKAEAFLELGGFKKDIAFLVFSGLSLIISLFDLLPLPFDAAWVAIILCGVPIIMEAIIGLDRDHSLRHPDHHGSGHRPGHCL